MKKPEYIFETSWEVCNMVGGIYTVISSKAKILKEEYGDNYITIGPDVWKETHHNPYFIEDLNLFAEWRQKATQQGLKVRIGRWAIESKPVAILIDFTPLFAQKDVIFASFWESFQLDSIQGQWDYVEPALFGYAAGQVIESFFGFYISGYDKIIAQFHEWMTGTGVLYLKENVPQIGTVFTTHATYLGRALAGNGFPLYRDLLEYNPGTMANRFNITAQQSLERSAARESDAFTTVSQNTANECAQFLGRIPDSLTINGFDQNKIPSSEALAAKRKQARKKILEVASKMTGSKISDQTMLVLTSGRYEFKNKGIDLFIDALGKLNNDKSLKKEILAVIAVPANIAGPVEQLTGKLSKQPADIPSEYKFTTHCLYDTVHDAIVNRIKNAGLTNGESDKVKVIFVPSYLKGNDGVFNLHYYDFLTGFDLTVFPSYYEPWGYTPLESIAFAIPTVTTSLAGFGQWVKEMGKDGEAVTVITRNDDNEIAVVDAIIQKLQFFNDIDEAVYQGFRKQAQEIASNAVWEMLIKNYEKAYEMALIKVGERVQLFDSRKYTETLRTFNYHKQDEPTWKKVLIQPVFANRLKKLSELAQNLWWSWNYEAIALFESINPVAWQAAEQNPITMMEGLSMKQMDALEKDEQFIERLTKVYNDFKAYMEVVPKSDDRIAYFSMEYGLHKSLKIYSGGLGILAGDYLKEASDSAVNMVAIGLLYRYGYFTQDISLVGDQIAQYLPQKFTHLPLEPVRDKNGDWVTISLAMPGRSVVAKAWKVNVGRVPLYLLDTDIEENSMEDRNITHQLYGGDSEMRFKQESVLGVGGIRLLEKLEINPLIFHCNEGHAAFIGLERLRIFVELKHIRFDVAREIVRASTLFTTHTPVPAGHDAFEENLLRTYVPHYPERLNISWDEFMNLGRFRQNDPADKFSMSVLATNLSQEVNGVSQIHGRVSREMFQPLFPGYFPDELHIGYVTNGVHYPTWTDASWQQLYKKYFAPGFEHDQSNAGLWTAIHDVPDQEIWNIRTSLKADLLAYVKYRVKNDLTEREESPKLIVKTLESINKNALVIGFARRFATYKRAHLLFTNLEKLSKIVNNPDFPVLFLFAGKAHPNDKAGQDLIKRIVEVSKMPEFIGKVLFIENYDMELGKRLTSSVDIWLNTPTRPLEASGTSGEKAVMNGVLNFSVLDGWWAEGYKANAGWAIQEKRTYNNQFYQDELDVETIYSLLEQEIVPMYFNRNADGVPEKWVKFIKNNISEIAPHFTMKRMLDDYFDRYYNKLIGRSRKMQRDNLKFAHEMAAWKANIKAHWDAIEVKSIKVPDPTIRPLNFGENFVAEITLNTPGIKAGDVSIELLFGRKLFDKIDEIVFVEKMNLVRSGDEWAEFKINVPVFRAGVYDYTFRIYPSNNDLPHRQDLPLLKWI
ncbi:MAG: alpha-glucan family phosphorylase [Bacteroidales bacterium]|nr:alpha-glucan family phosphorylase [Bacteroidales bacterium]